MSLFNAYHVGDVAVSENEATLSELVMLGMDYRYVFTPELYAAFATLSPAQRGTLFLELGEQLNTLVYGNQSRKHSPLYREFPNHTIVPMAERVAFSLIRSFGFMIEHDADKYGADPVTGFQTSTFAADGDADEAFVIEFDQTKGGNTRREYRVLRLADAELIGSKSAAMIGNLTPFSSQELSFVTWALDNNMVDTDALTSVRFREKLPLVAAHIDNYADACNSVTDALRLAAFISGGDISLMTKTKFKLSTSNRKKILDLVERIIVRGNTDFETDFKRHGEKWKRLASHLYTKNNQKRFPHAVDALHGLRDGTMTSWEQKFANAGVDEKVNMAIERPGVFVRRLVQLLRGTTNDTQLKAVVSACEQVFSQVDAMKLMQLHTHLTKTVNKTTRIHLLPSGSLLSSEKMVDTVPSEIVEVLEKELHSRLNGSLPYVASSDAATRFIPAGNSSSSETDVRTSRGDRVQLSFSDDDTVRLFLFWNERCDVDLSAVFYTDTFAEDRHCSYMNLTGPYCTHSGDILDGSGGAAEYIDINVGKAKKAGIRYVLANANVYSGMSFDTFECNTGIMVRDGSTGKHFEASTVETKLSLDSPSRNTTAVVFDLETGQMIFVDLHGMWAQHSNVVTKSASLNEALQYFINYDEYRPSFADVLTFAGTDGSPEATVSDIEDNQDEILEMLSSK